MVSVWTLASRLRISIENSQKGVTLAAWAVPLLERDGPAFLVGLGADEEEAMGTSWAGVGKQAGAQAIAGDIKARASVFEGGKNDTRWVVSSEAANIVLPFVLDPPSLFDGRTLFGDIEHRRT